MKLENKSARKNQRQITVAVIAMTILATLVVILDWHSVRQIGDSADWRFTLVAIGFTIISYVCLSVSYALANRYFGIRVGWWDLYNIGFTSSTLNNVLAFMGAAGHSLRLVLIGDRSKPGSVLAASIFHSYLNNVVMLALLPLSLLWLLFSHSISGGAAVSLGLLAGVLTFLLLIVTFALFFNPLRSRILHLSGKIWFFVTKKDILHFLVDMDNTLKEGFVAVEGKRLAFVVLLLAADWAAAAASLYFCFLALGLEPGWGTTLSGFGFGIVAGNISFIPGGIGIQEASMAGIYALLGISFSQAMLVAILFRVVYDFLPFFFSLVFYRRLLKRRD